MKRLTVISLGGGVQSLVMASGADHLTGIWEFRMRSRRKSELQKGGGKDYGY